MRHLGTVVLNCSMCGTTQHFISEHQMPERVWALTCLDCMNTGYLPESRWSSIPGINSFMDSSFYVVQEVATHVCDQCYENVSDVLNITDGVHNVMLRRCQSCAFVELEELWAVSPSHAFAL